MKRALVVAALALSAGCVRWVETVRPEPNHALLLDAKGWADTGVSLERLAQREWTLAIRVAPSYPKTLWGWFFGETSGRPWLIGQGMGTGRLYLHLGDVAVDTHVSLVAGRWQHVAIAWADGVATVFLDGKVVGAEQMPRPEPPLGNLRLGHRADGWAHEGFHGYLDDVVVLERAASQEEVAALSRGARPVGSPVRAVFDFEQGSSDAQLRGTAKVVASPDVGVAPAVSEDDAFDLPVDGEWLVAQGTEGHTHLGAAAFALDLMPFVAEGLQYTGNWESNAQHRCFERRVFAPFDGIAQNVRTRSVDSPPFFFSLLPSNQVRLVAENGAMLELHHFSYGSITVTDGQAVRKGETLGRCGSSGTGQPHVHFGWYSPNDRSQTRPFRIRDYEVMQADGTFKPGTGIPRVGEVIRKASAPVPRLPSRVDGPDRKALDAYRARLEAELRARLGKPAEFPEPRVGGVQVALDAKGAVVRSLVTHFSGDPAFDRALLYAVRRQPFSAPPQALVEHVGVRGLTLFGAVE